MNPQVKVDLVQQRLSPSVIKDLGGFIGRRFALNAANRLGTFDIDYYVRLVEARKHTEWWWLGEQPGKWLESAILTCRQNGDRVLADQARAVLARMLAAQEPGGYLGVTAEGVRTAEMPMRGMDAYELYFTLHALLTAHQEWSDAAALAAAGRLGDFFVDKIGPGKAEFWPRPKGQTIAGHPGHFSLEGTLLVDPMMRLYLATGEKRYLQWCQTIVAQIDRWSGHDSFSNLDKVAAGQIGIHQIQPKVHSHTLHMNLLGFLKLYRVTGDASLLRKVLGAWDDIAAKHVHVTGGVSVKEHYKDPHELPHEGEVVETCASMSWIQLCQDLLELTGDSKYADAIERLLWNHVWAAQTCDGDGFRYQTPLNGIKPAGYFTGPDCCSSSGPRIIAMAPGLIYARGPEGLYVNQFVPSTAYVPLDSGQELGISQVGDFPVGEHVRIKVRLARPETFALHVRLPAWCDQPTVTINSRPAAVEAKGRYAVLRRQWQAGDAVELTLPMSFRWLRGAHAQEGLWCLTRGPIVYVLDSVWFDQAADQVLSSGPFSIRLDPAHPSAGLAAAATPPNALGPACQVEAVGPQGQGARALVVPFANVGFWYRNEADRQDPKAERYRYAVWLPAAGRP